MLSPLRSFPSGEPLPCGFALGRMGLVLARRGCC
nr:MAG TPA: hypothetical protein [Caudoviricetes sp.]